MSAPLTSHIEAAIAGLKAYNDIQSAWRANVKAGGYAAHFKDAPQIPDHLHIELLEAISAFDCDPQGTLDELRRQAKPCEGNLLHFSLPSDEEFDFATSRGLAA